MAKLNKIPTSKPEVPFGCDILRSGNEYYKTFTKFGEYHPYDKYRIRIVEKYIVGESVLEVGCYSCLLLKRIRDKISKVAGTEVNDARVKLANEIMGEPVVVKGVLQDGLEFENEAFDTIVCLEVLEHIPGNTKQYVNELIRVSSRRIIISVPYKEKIKYETCIYCHKKTPRSGHFHSFVEKDFIKMLPNNVRITKIVRCLNLISQGLAYMFDIPYPIFSFIDKLCNNIFKDLSTDMIIILDKH